MADWSYEAFRKQFDEECFIPSSAYVVDGVDYLRLDFENTMARTVIEGHTDEQMCFTCHLKDARQNTQSVVLRSADILPEDADPSVLAMLSLYRCGGDGDKTLMEALPTRYKSIIERGWGDFREALTDPDPEVAFVCVARVLNEANILSGLEAYYAKRGGFRLTEEFERQSQNEGFEACLELVRERFGDATVLDELERRSKLWDRVQGMADHASGDAFFQPKPRK